MITIKRIIALVCGAVLMGGLAACTTGRPGTSPSPSQTSALMPSQYTDADFGDPGDIVIKTEYDVYGDDAPEVSFTITNTTASEYVYGVPYEIEVYRDGKWYTVPFPENTAWIEIGIILKTHDTNSDSFKFSELNYQMTDGKYRLIKQIGEKRYFSEFQIGPSPITAETPFGYKALEKLPKDYTKEAAVSNGDVVIMHAEIKNTEKITDFVNKAALGMSAMVRIVQYTVEGDPIITDCIFNQDHRAYYLYRHDSSRDKFGGAGTGITETIYSYLITDSEALYLSDVASWELASNYMNPGSVQLSPAYSSDLSEQINLVKKMTAERLEWNIARYRAFSPDTSQNVSLYGGLSYGYEGHTSSETRQVKDPEGIANEIIGVIWLNNASFVLVCKTNSSQTYFDVVGQSDYLSGYGSGYTVTDGHFEIIK